MEGCVYQGTIWQLRATEKREKTITSDEAPRHRLLPPSPTHDPSLNKPRENLWSIKYQS